ncbi:hypothetical protein GCM10009534_08170 [Kribbella sandramycini]
MALRPTTEGEFPELFERAVESFAAGVGPARDLEPASALRYARESIAKLVPNGLHSPHQLIYTAWAGDVMVGSVWIGTAGPIPYIYNLEVLADQRGRGYGRAIMLATADECRRLGYHRLDLNVFADNAAALNLYTSLGYTVVSQQMRREL